MASSASAATRFQRVAVCARLALLGVTAAAVLYTAYGFGRLLAEWRQVSRPAALEPTSTTTAASLNAVSAVLPLAGQWSFAGLDWSLATQSIARADIDARLDTLADQPATDGDLLPDVSRELFDFAAMLRIKPINRGGNQVYRVDRPDLKAQLVVRHVDGKPKAVGMAAAYPHRSSSWRLTILHPRPATAHDHPLQSAPHLLPLPAEVTRSGGRFDDDGQLLLELVTLDSNADTLIAGWKAAGWQVRPSGMGRLGDFSYLCARGEEVVYAWSAHPASALRSLMLVRTPASSDTSTSS